jgi:molecular chaperone GrpE
MIEEPEKVGKIPVRGGHEDAATETGAGPAPDEGGAAEPGMEDPLAEPGAPAELAAVAAERDQALAEKAELLDKFRRAQAEFENARKQVQRDKHEALEYAAMDTIRSMLPILDDFERALSTPGLDADFQKGLRLIHEQMLDAFTRAGLKPLEHEGKFNPHFHHAVDKAPAESEEQDQDILDVYQKGYFFKDRLLRPAMVKVAVRE